jgi:Multiubiquitin
MQVLVPNKHTVRIHIDRQPFESPSATTGAELYVLANVTPAYELFKESIGDHEDDAVARDNHVIHLRQDEHFYSQREFKIIVNTRAKETPKRQLSFDEVVHLAFETPPTGPNIKFTITYRHGPRQNREGTMTEGESVFIRNRMVFNVTPTDKS